MMRRIGLVAIFGLVAGDPAFAQFGSLMNSTRQPSAPAQASGTPSSGGCAGGKPKSRGSVLMGHMLGNLANRTVGRSGVASFVPIPEVTGILTDAIACKLDEGEQKQAASATNAAVRSGEVGSTSSWKSDTREGVSGTSTVTARNEAGDGSSCMQVNDVIIVDGEETTVQKKMCRASGQSGYTLSA